MYKKFEMQGIASGAIRSDEEMKTIDKELAVTNISYIQDCKEKEEDYTM